MSARVSRVAVRGGELAVGEWGPPTGEPVLAIHGITASHLAWAAVADALPEMRILAPDLRGRGASAGLPPPYGMAQHALDCAAVLDALGIARARVVGHSMGAFVAAAFAAAYPARVAGLVLVDGGLPLVTPPGLDREAAIAASLGPALARLTMTFPSRAAYQAFWRAHPAFAADWSAQIAAYADYDLVAGPDGALRPPTPVAAVRDDSAELYGEAAEAAVAAVPAGTALLTAPRGLQDAAPLYAPEVIAAWAARVPALAVREVPNVNHYTIVMAPRGAAEVARAVRAAR